MFRRLVGCYCSCPPAQLEIRNFLFRSQKNLGLRGDRSPCITQSSYVRRGSFCFRPRTQSPTANISSILYRVHMLFLLSYHRVRRMVADYLLLTLNSEVAHSVVVGRNVWDAPHGHILSCLHFFTPLLNAQLRNLMEKR